MTDEHNKRCGRGKGKDTVKDIIALGYRGYKEI